MAPGKKTTSLTLLGCIFVRFTRNFIKIKVPPIPGGDIDPPEPTGTLKNHQRHSENRRPPTEVRRSEEDPSWGKRGICGSYPLCKVTSRGSNKTLFLVKMQKYDFIFSENVQDPSLSKRGSQLGQKRKSSTLFWGFF